MSASTTFELGKCELLCDPNYMDAEGFRSGYLRLPIGSNIQIVSPGGFSYEQHVAHCQYILDAVNARSEALAPSPEPGEASALRSAAQEAANLVDDIRAMVDAMDMPDVVAKAEAALAALAAAGVE